MNLNDIIMEEIKFSSKSKIDPTQNGKFDWAAADLSHKFDQLQKMYGAGQRILDQVSTARKTEVKGKSGEMMLSKEDADKLVGRVLSGFKQIRKLLGDINNDLVIIEHTLTQGQE